MVASLGLPSLSLPVPPLQGWLRRPRCRRCLLKGCEQRFRPSRPQSRYCSDPCQHQARRWRRWRAGQKYRASQQGKERRRHQSQRGRERRRQAGVPVASSVTPVVDVPPSTISPSPSPPSSAAAAAQLDRGGGVGQRPAIFSRIFPYHPCDRPGCYELFVVRPRSPGQHFCCVSCRQALRRVLDREARWRRRGRQRARAGQRRPQRPPQRC
jgi:hypothetical protein